MRTIQVLGPVVFLQTAAACSGILVIDANDAPEPDEPRACSVVQPRGECPGSLQCCSGVCDESCEGWTCSCEGDQACLNGDCVDITPEVACSVLRPEGLCPTGELCLDGTCVPLSGPCGCDPGLACVDGECVEIPDDEACSRERPDGLCPDSQRCLDGACMTIDNLCSAAHPTGLCPPGAVCVDGYCRSVEDLPCDPEDPEGWCPSCYTCLPPGQCELVSCSPDAPSCACPRSGDICLGGACVCLPCSPGHPSGCCPEGSLCSAAGLCLAEGTCILDGDCRASGTICSCEGACISLGSCACDSDCGDFHACVNGVCTRVTDCPGGDADCPAGELCDSTAQCRLAGTCGAHADCRTAGTFCSACGECLTTGYCCEPADCEADRFCSSAGTCLADGECASDGDCPPGESCSSQVCTPTGAPCTTNGPASCIPGAGGSLHWCCPTGDPADCCPQGQRCGAAGLCIIDGTCIDDSDCLAGYFTCVEDTCVPITTCTSSCAEGLTCSVAGGCIAPGTCAADGDCPTGQVCNALFACEPAVACGHEEFEATLVPPNMLVVLDRSGSMNWCLTCPQEQQDCEAAAGCVWQDGACESECSGYTTRRSCNRNPPCRWDATDVCMPPLTRWDTAVGVLDEVLTVYQDQIRFGLSLYPLPCTGSCTEACDHEDYCTTCPSDPGTVEVRVNEGTQAAVSAELHATFPGGGTPTAPTLREVEAERQGFGLPAADDEVARANFILLVTDGDANNGGTDLNCGSDPSQADRVNCALDRLRQATPPVKTFVVGFAFGGNTTNLNCHAFYGGTARQDTCAGVDASTCDDVAGPCYYPAGNRAELLATFDGIVGSVASCSYALDGVPPDLGRLYVYLDYQCSGVAGEAACEATPGCSFVDGACAGEPVWLPKDTSQTNGWSYDIDNNQVTFAGAACDLLQAGVVLPVVILGCSGSEG